MACCALVGPAGEEIGIRLRITDQVGRDGGLGLAHLDLGGQTCRQAEGCQTRK